MLVAFLAHCSPVTESFACASAGLCTKLLRSFHNLDLNLFSSYNQFILILDSFDSEHLC